MSKITIGLTPKAAHILFELSKSDSGCSWRGAVCGIEMSETGARNALENLVKLGLATGGPSRWYITEKGTNHAESLRKKGKEQRKQKKAQKTFF